MFVAVICLWINLYLSKVSNKVSLTSGMLSAMMVKLMDASLCPDKKITEPLTGCRSSSVRSARLGPSGWRLQNTSAWPSVPSRLKGRLTWSTERHQINVQKSCSHMAKNFWNQKEKKKKKRSDQKLQSLRLKTFKLKLDNLSYSSSLECRSIWHIIEFKQYMYTLHPSKYNLSTVRFI